MDAAKAVRDLERALVVGATKDWWTALVGLIDRMSDDEAQKMLANACETLKTGPEGVLAVCKSSMEASRAEGHKEHEAYWSRLLQRLSRAAGL